MIDKLYDTINEYGTDSVQAEIVEHGFMAVQHRKQMILAKMNNTEKWQEYYVNYNRAQFELHNKFYQEGVSGFNYTKGA